MNHLIYAVVSVIGEALWTMFAIFGICITANFVLGYIRSRSK